MFSLATESYTDAAVLKLLMKSRTILFEYMLFDNGDMFLGMLSDCSGTISQNSQDDIACTGNFTLKENELSDINTADERLVPVFCLLAPTGEWLKYELGRYVLSSPVRSSNGGAVYRSVEAYDQTIILTEDKAASRVLIRAGQPYTNAVLAILSQAGILQTMVEYSALQIPVDLEFEIGTPKLVIINYLLKAINFVPLYFDAKGYACSRPYIEPVQRKIDRSFVSDALSVMLSGAEQSMDIFGIPNKFIRYLSSPERGELISVYTNTDTTSVLSVPNRGRVITDIEKVDDIADRATLDSYTRRAAAERMQAYETVKFQSALMPGHEYQDCIAVINNELGISDKYVETAWQMELAAGGKMIHTMRKAVPLV